MNPYYIISVPADTALCVTVIVCVNLYQFVDREVYTYIYLDIGDEPLGLKRERFAGAL